MRTKLLVTVAIPLMACLCSREALAQTEWEKHPCNPVFAAGPPGSWYEILHGHYVLLDDEAGKRIFKMWFSSDVLITGIGYATSADGLHWDTQPDQVIPAGPRGSWNDVFLSFPSVMKHQGKYKMWVNGWSSMPIAGSNDTMGYFDSDDGIAWRAYPENPIFIPTMPAEDWPLTPPAQGKAKNLAAQVPTVVIRDGVFHLWYSGVVDFSSGVAMIGHATSPDGIRDWVKDPQNPVVLPGGPGEPDDRTISDAYVLFAGGQFQMWYQRLLPPNAGALFMFATSSDGTTWEKHSQPVLTPGPAGSWDGAAIDQPCVVFDEEKNLYHMWYRGLSDAAQTKAAIGYASSIVTLRSVSPPRAGDLTGAVKIALKQARRIGTPDQVLTVKEEARGAFTKDAVSAPGGAVADLPSAPVAPVGLFSDARTITRSAVCPEGNGGARFDAAEGAFTLDNLGEDVGPGGDSFTFAYSRIKGDFDLTAGIKTPGSPNTPRPGKSGLMVRQDLSPRSRFFFLFDRWGDPFDAVRWASRAEHGSPDVEEVVDLAPGDHFDHLKIERRGNIIRALIDTSKAVPREEAWELLHEETWSGVPEAVLVGLAFSSLTSICCKGPASIAFDQVKLDLLAGAEVLPPVLEPLGVEITWQVLRTELIEKGVEYSIIPVTPGEIRFRAGEEGIGIAGEERVEVNVSAPPRFKRGDVEPDGKLNLTDAIVVLNYLFLAGPPPACLDAADVDDTGVLNLTDPIYLLNYLFLAGPGPKPPGPNTCGPDETAAIPPDPPFPPCIYPLGSC